MTNGMRWGVTSLSIVGIAALGAFNGCSSDDNAGPPPFTDSGVDSQIDSGADTPGDTPKDSPGDTTDAPAPPDRQVTFVFASPDSPPEYMCLGGFAGDPATSTKPLQSLGPFGIPNDPADPKKGLKSGFPYGAVVPFPISDPLIKTALDSFNVIIYFSATDPSKGGSTDPCGDLWATAKTDPTMNFALPKGKVAAGTSSMMALAGCRAAATDTTGACPAAANFKFEFQPLDVADPTSFAGGGTGAKAGLQFYDLSNFPAFQSVDVYIQPMGGSSSDAGTDAADGDASASTPAGPPIQIAGTAAAGVSFESLTAPAVGVQPKGDPDSAELLVVKHGTAPCDPATCTTTIGLPLATFEAAYKAAGIAAGWKGNQTLVLAGSPLPKTPGDPKTAPLIIAWVPNKF